MGFIQIRKISWRRAWQITPVILSGESHGQRSLVGYSPWGCKESDMTERLHIVMVSDNEAGRGQLHVRKSRRSARGVEMAQARHRLEDRDHLLQTLPPNIGSSFCQERTGIKGLSHLFSSVQSLSHVQLYATPWTVTYQAPPSMGFPRQEYRVGCHSFLQVIFPTQGLNPDLPHCRQILYCLSHQGSPGDYYMIVNQENV